MLSSLALEQGARPAAKPWWLDGIYSDFPDIPFILTGPWSGKWDRHCCSTDGEHQNGSADWGTKIKVTQPGTVVTFPVCPLDSRTLTCKPQQPLITPPTHTQNKILSQNTSSSNKNTWTFFSSFHLTLIFSLKINPSSSKELGEREQIDGEIKQFGFV